MRNEPTETLTPTERADLERRSSKNDYVWKAEQKALRIIDAQAKRIEELEAGQRQDDAEIRRLKACRFAPAERAVLDACAELLLVPEKGGRVRVPNQHQIELVGEAEWAKRQEHQLADREEGLDYVTHPVHGGPVLRSSLEAEQKTAEAPSACPRQHLSPAAEQRMRREQGPCACPSCTACRTRGMS